MSFFPERFSNNAYTTLAETITSLSTTVHVDDPTRFPTKAPFRLIIGLELFRVTAVSGAYFTVQRGVENTLALGHPLGATVAHVLTKEGLLNSFEFNGTANVRLSLSATDPHPNAASGNTVYALPYGGSRISLLDNTDNHWRLADIPSGIPASIGGYPSGTPIDLFMYFDETSQAAKLESTPWQTTTGRVPATDLTTMNGRLVRLDDTTRLYLGTAYPSQSGFCYDTPNHRHLYNRFNKVDRSLFVIADFANYDYATATIRPVNNSVNNRVDFMVGVSGDSYFTADGCLSVWQASTYGSTLAYNLGFGLDSVAAMTGKKMGGVFPYYSTVEVHSHDDFRPDIGFHYLQLLEQGAGVTVTVYGSGLNYKGGICGSIMA